MNKLPEDSVFYDPPNFTCSECGSHRGRWLHDAFANGVTLECRECGHHVKSYRSWVTELLERDRR